MITIDATALTFDAFRIPGVGQFSTCTPQLLDLAPGRYRFGTLYGAEFKFLVTEAGTVDYDSSLTFLSGAGTPALTVFGCEISVDATALTFEAFGLYDSASGLTRYFSSTSVQVVRLIPGRYRFGTLYGAAFEFSITDSCTVDYDSSLTFLAGAGTPALTVFGCEISVDATALTFESFGLYDSASGLTRYFASTSAQVVRLIPGRYRFGTLYGAAFEFSVTDSCTVDYDPSLTFLSGAGTPALTVFGCEISVDATALTFESFGLYDSASGLTRYFSSTGVQVVRLIPGRYRFGTLYGAAFEFSVTDSCTVDYDSSLTFLSGAGTPALTVFGCEISVDATALTFEAFGLYDSASGLTRYFSSTSVQVVRLIPGRYRFGTLYGAAFEFSITDSCTVDYDSSLTFLSGAGTPALTVFGFLVNVDARSLPASFFTLGDSASGLTVSRSTTASQCVTLIPGSYVFTCGFTFGFLITAGGTFDYDPAFLRCVTGLGRQHLRVFCDSTGP